MRAAGREFADELVAERAELEEFDERSARRRKRRSARRLRCAERGEKSRAHLDALLEDTRSSRTPRANRTCGVLNRSTSLRARALREGRDVDTVEDDRARVGHLVTEMMVEQGVLPDPLGRSHRALRFAQREGEIVDGGMPPKVFTSRSPRGSAAPAPAPASAPSVGRLTARGKRTGP